MTVISCKDGRKTGMEPGKYVRYTPEQVETLERLYHECPKPSSIRRQQLIREFPILSYIEPKQIKVWFQNRRCREKQRKEFSRLQAVNRKLTAMNKLLMEENDRMQRKVSQLVYENGSFRQRTQRAEITTTDTSCDSVVTNGQPHLPLHCQQKNSTSDGLLSIAEETLTEFLSKATGTAVEWVLMPGMKPGPDSIGIISIVQGCTGVAARVCGLVSLQPAKVAEILKDRLSWLRDCRSVNVVDVLQSGNGGTIESLYIQLYAPTALAPARDLWVLRYTSRMDDGSLVVCERSLNRMQGSPSMPAMPPFIRAEILPSGYLIRACEVGGSIVHIIDHMDFEPWSVPEVIRPFYESSLILAQRTTMLAFQQLRQIASELSHHTVSGWARSPAALRALSLRLSRGFNEAVNGFPDEGWSMIGSDEMDDFTVMVNSKPCSRGINSNMLQVSPYSVICAKVSMLLQNVPPPFLIRFLREHRSEWADGNIDVYSVSDVKDSAFSMPGLHDTGGYQGQVVLPLACTLDDDEFLEILKLENCSNNQDLMPKDRLFLQLCNGLDENIVGTCSELIFAPINASFVDDAPLLPSGFRIIPLKHAWEASSRNRTLDIASSLEVGITGNRILARDCQNGVAGGGVRSVITIAFQIPCESHLQASVVAMARQYLRNTIQAVQKVDLAFSPCTISQTGLGKMAGGSPELGTLSRWICNSYRYHFGVDLFNSVNNYELLKMLWHHSDALLCCSLKAMPTFTFGNQAGLDMLDTTFEALQHITLEKIFKDLGNKSLATELSNILDQGFGCIEGEVSVSSKGSVPSYEKAVWWKVYNDQKEPHCVCFLFLLLPCISLI